MSLSKHHLSDSELSPFFTGESNTDDNSRAVALIKQQSDPVGGWPRYLRNLEAYSGIQKETVAIQGIDIVVTLNETRAPSITSKTFESEHAKSQPCLLCKLDKEQKGVLTLNNRFIILANPGITMPGDLTIASVNHVPQLIADYFEDMIMLSKTLTEYSIFFNGAMAGASSPHFHFQAGIKNTLIAEQQIDRILAGLPVGNLELIPLKKSKSSCLFFLKNYLRAAYLIVTHDIKELNRIFREFSQCLRQVDRQIHNIPNVPDFGSFIASLNIEESEPRMNLMLRYDPGTAKYMLLIFPKIFNRPAAYYKSGPDQVIVGMAIKESLGNLISCRTSDFQNLLYSPELISEIYRDTSISKAMIDKLNGKIPSEFCYGCSELTIT